MTSPSPACPEIDVLGRYIRALLTDGDSGQIAEHLESCCRCEEIVSQLERRHHQQIRDAMRPLEPADASVAQAARMLARRHLATLKPRDVIGDCTLIQELGSGSFARVFLAHQHSMQRFVAVKISARPSNEPKLLSSLDHRHIVRVYHYDDRLLSKQGLYVLYMQYVPGCSLKDVLIELGAVPIADRSGDLLLSTIQRLTEGHVPSRTTYTQDRSSLNGRSWIEAVCWIGARVADALQYAHSHGVLHRDVKPANILLLPNGSPMLLDFNVGFGTEIDGATPADDFGGSLPYMSPEQLSAFRHHEAADVVGQSSDIYSLAVVLYELITGTRPRSSDTLAQTATVDGDKQTHEVSSTSEPRFPDVCPRGLREVLIRCLARDPQTRYRSAHLVSRKLHVCTDWRMHKLLFPRPSGVRDWIIRHPLTTLMAAGLIPNGSLAVVNFSFNVLNSTLDQALLQRNHVYVDLIIFPLGIGILIQFVWPILKALQADDQQIIEKWLKISRRCLSMGSYFSVVILTLWVATGVIYPALDAWLSELPGERNYPEFFMSQLLHGLLAASITFFCVSFVALEAFFPALLHGPRPAETRRLLPGTLKRVDRHSAILGLTPPFALIALAAFNHSQPLLLISLGVLGIIGCVIALLAAPRIKSAIATCDRLLMPIENLLHGEMDEPGEARSESR